MRAVQMTAAGGPGVLVIACQIAKSRLISYN
jgi:hypothetical protein